MQRMMKKTLTLLLALSMVLVFTACGGSGGGGDADADDNEVYTLVFSTHLPETGVDGASLKAYLEDVEAACDGRLVIEKNFAGSMTKNTETLPAVSSGSVDIAFVPEGFFSELYPTSVATIPYTTTSEWVAGKAMNEMFNNYEPWKKMQEDNNVHYIGAFVPSEVVLVSKSKEINGYDDLKGLKVRAGGQVANYMNQLGATAVALDASAIYENLNNGTVEAATAIPVTLAVTFKLQEIADHFIFTGMGTYTTSSLYMNKEVWDSLPEDIQQAFITTYNDKWIDLYSQEEWMGGELKKSIAEIEGAGKEVTIFSEEEQAKCKDALASATDDFIAQCDSMGYNGQEIVDTYRSYVEQYQKDDIAYQLY